MGLASVKRRWLVPLGIAVIVTSLIILFLGHPSGTQLYITIANAVFFVCITIIVFFMYYFFQIERKKIVLEYHLKPDVPVLNAKPSKEGVVGTAFEVRSGSFYLVTLKIRNSGNTPITPKDFFSDLTINFGDEAKILAVDVIEAKTGNFKLNYTKDPHELLIEPLLLNGKNFIKLAVLLEGIVDDVVVSGDIADTKQKVVRM